MHGRRASDELLDSTVMKSIKREFSHTSPFLPWISEGMAKYSNQEKAGMHFMYGLPNGNALEAERLYRQHFPRRHVSDRKMFERLHWCLCETGSFVTSMHVTGRGRSVQMPQVVEDVLQRVEDCPDISTREVSRAVNVLHSTVWRVLRDEGLHPYHVQKVQAFIPADYAPRVEFAHWFLQQRSLILVHMCYSQMKAPLLVKAFLIHTTFMCEHLAIRTTHVLMHIRSISA
ncbi:hypothetical protein AVEN_159676-1 [Araneus ventricosus]|uniref:DUF4817 domain-containing protein n=1 Tax=Araneus ventricosus TaxID=182803 RepID=A0A4Y2FJL8_ARAVE|nr:hypothetical protein AVEN_159676-1 [Araneus ventricosus]